jgi:hypothetical protein
MEDAYLAGYMTADIQMLMAGSRLIYYKCESDWRNTVHGFGMVLSER